MHRQHTFEELGSQSCINVDVSFDVERIKGAIGSRDEFGRMDTPPDPDEVVVTEVFVESIVGDNYEWTHEQRPDWFEFLTRIMDAMIDDVDQFANETLLDYPMCA